MCQDGTTYFKCQEAGNYTFNSKVSVKGLSAGTYDASTNTILMKPIQHLLHIKLRKHSMIIRQSVRSLCQNIAHQG